MDPGMAPLKEYCRAGNNPNVIEVLKFIAFQVSARGQGSFLQSLHRAEKAIICDYNFFI